MGVPTGCSNNPAYLADLRATLKAVAQDDPNDDEPELGGDQRRAVRTWSMGDRLGEERIREIVERFRDGATKQELADKFSVSLSSIKRILRANNARRASDCST